MSIMIPIFIPTSSNSDDDDDDTPAYIVNNGTTDFTMRNDQLVYRQRTKLIEFTEAHETLMGLGSLLIGAILGYMLYVSINAHEGFEPEHISDYGFLDAFPLILFMVIGALVGGGIAFGVIAIIEGHGFTPMRTPEDARTAFNDIPLIIHGGPAWANQLFIAVYLYNTCSAGDDAEKYEAITDVCHDIALAAHPTSD